MPSTEENIDISHRIGMEYTEKNWGKKLKSIFVKFKLWRAWKLFYDARPKIFKDGKKKPGHKSFSVSVELTKRHYLLLSVVEGLIKNNNDIDFSFAILIGPFDLDTKMVNIGTSIVKTSFKFDK